MDNDVSWRIITITAPIIAITFATMGWFMRDVFEASSRELPLVQSQSGQTSLPRADRRVLSLIFVGALLVILIASLDLYVGFRHTELQTASWLDSRRVLFTVVMGGPVLGAAWIISLLVPMLRQARDVALVAWRRDETILIPPPKEIAVEADPRFQPHKRQLELWRSGYNIVKAHQQDWQLGSRFLVTRSNQEALGAFVHQALKQLDIPLHQIRLETEDYETLFVEVGRLVDDGLASADAPLARSPQRVNELVRTAFYLYHQMTTSGR